MTRATDCLLLLALSLALPSCDDAASRGRSDDAGDLADSGTSGPMDATVDVASDIGPTPPDPGATGYPATAESGTSGPGGADPDFERAGDDSFACYDGVDNDGDLGADCADDGCAALHSCCVGDGDCCFAAPGPTPPTGLSFTSCGPEVGDCLPAGGATPFGSPSPFIADGGLAPGGDGEFDSGLLFDESVDLSSHRVVLSARFGAAVDCAEGCVEGVSASLTYDTMLGAEDHVRVVAGLLASGSRGDVSLVLSDAIVTRWPSSSDDEIWSLTVRPTGEVSVLRDGVPLEGGSGAILPRRGARVVVHGHSRNPSATPPTGVRLLSLDVATSLCDVPSSWGPRQDVLLRATSTGEITPPALEALSLSYDGTGRATVALGADHAIFLSKRPGTLTTELTLTDVLSNPALEGGRAHDAHGVFDPELVWDEGGARWVLLYSGQSDGGEGDDVRSIGRATAEASASIFTPDDGPVLEPADYSVRGFDQPTVAVHEDGTWVMVVRAELLDGQREFWALLSNDQGQSFRRVEGVRLDQALAPGQGALFDADEVSQPSLAIHGGAYRLYFARRLGARWSIGLVVSDELVSWRHPLDGAPVLLGAGELERVGVTAPSVAIQNERVELYYLALDGVGATLRRTDHMATAAGL